MSHELELREDGTALMAYSGELPWHGLGKPVPADLTAEQMLKAAGLDWTVEKIPLFFEIPDPKDDGLVVAIPAPASALVRSTDRKVLDVVTPKWNPLQNAEAFQFFHDFVMSGDMEMHTAGSLKGGQLVWALARIKEGFVVGKSKDEVQSHLLFSNPHQFGKSIDIRFTPIRVVCWNTICMALSGTKDLTVTQQVVRANHRKPFDAEKVKDTLGLAHSRLEEYKDAANFLAGKRFTDETLNQLFASIFPKSGETEGFSRNHKLALEAVVKQPGAEMNAGSFWQAFNAITFLTDHTLGRGPETRLDSAWFGSNRALKSRALNEAVELAKKAPDLVIA
jgi:phage/plasmid-like protein (TIGR03299 family)